ncbi:MAG: hypothetical protein HQL52_03905 [Magnetococcales bacterium]|nr:hypothetical protein [Magnetococcales bacterium]
MVAKPKTQEEPKPEPKVKVTFIKTHTHGGVQYHAGNVAEVRQGAVAKLVKKGVIQDPANPQPKKEEG